MEGKAIRLYPGGNTSRGFYSFYKYIIDSFGATKIYIIKGGPGVGKSTFMKQVTQDCRKAGYDVELHYCSSDNNSLDGVVISELGIALIDGTSPHIVDPKHPGAIDTIIHLGDYWDEDKMRECRERILNSTKTYQRNFHRAYGCLAAASVFWKQVNAYYQDMNAINWIEFRQRAQELLKDIFGTTETQSKESMTRHLFASAITPQGCCNSLQDIAGLADKVIVVEETPCLGENMLITLAMRQAELLGVDYTAFHCALRPEKVEHLLLPELGIAIISSNRFHSYVPGNEDIVLRIDLLTHCEALSDIWEERECFLNLFNESIAKGIEFIGKAKCEHDQLETNYVPNMDFEGIEELRKKVVEEILMFAKDMPA